jgi:hypothetical protein
MKKYPTVSKVALVPLRKALSAGRAEALKSPVVCTFRPNRINPTLKSTRNDTIPIPERNKRSLILFSP